MSVELHAIISGLIISIAGFLPLLHTENIFIGLVAGIVAYITCFIDFQRRLKKGEL
jgi:hypothetical protein